MSKRISRLGVLVAAAGLAFALDPATAAELLVKLHDPSKAATQELVRTHRGLDAGVATGATGWLRFQTADADGRATAAALRRDARVAAVLEPRREPLAMAPNDTLYASEQWWLGSLAEGSAALADLPNAWNRSTGRPATPSTPVVAVLDSGYTNHPELDSRWLGTGYDFVSSVDYANDGDGRDADARDPGDRLSAADIDANRQLWDGCEPRERSTWHGTLMAGQIGAATDNASGVAGIHWDARILPVRVAGRCGASVADVVDGMRWAAGLAVAGAPANTHPARVIVVGVAGFEPCDTSHADPNVRAAAQLYIDALAEIRIQGALVVAAAGNQRTAVGRPASCPGALAVTSLNRQGFKAIYANYGPQVALATVGGDAAGGRDCDAELADGGIASTFNLGTDGAGTFGYAAASGTSFAAPAVGGVAALMWSVNPALTPAQVEAGLRASARPHVLVPLLQSCDPASGNKAGRCQCDSTSCGAGILDAPGALAFADNPLGYQQSPRTAVLLDTPAIQRCARALGLPVPTNPPAGGGGNAGSDGGGGALGMVWLFALAMAVALLAANGGTLHTTSIIRRMVRRMARATADMRCP